MKNFRVVKTETIEKMMDCFANEEEYQNFALMINQMSQEMQYFGLKMVRHPDSMQLCLAKQVFSMAMFCRDNIDVIQQLVGIVDYSIVDEDIVENLTEEGKLEKEWD